MIWENGWLGGRGAAAVAMAAAGVLAVNSAGFAAAGEVRVNATGTADTRDSALVDACRLAVARVHGTRILGRLANRDASTKVAVKSETKAGDTTQSSKESRKLGTKDNTGMTFDGLLLRYEVLREGKDAQGRWEVQVSADVLDRLPDRFEGRQAVVIPPPARVAALFSRGVSNGLDPEPLARELVREVTAVFANHPQFVILERESEDALNEELARAAGGNAAVREQSKLKSEKAADLVVEIQAEPMRVEVENIRFELAPDLFKAAVQLRGNVRLLDVATKGELCRVPFEVKSPKPFAAAGSAAAAVKGAGEEVRALLEKSFRMVKWELLSHLGVANVLVSSDGKLAPLGGVDFAMLHSGDILTLWKRGEGSPVKLGESPVLAEGGSVLLVNSSLLLLRAGEAYAFRVSAPQILESERKPEPVAPSKPSLKDRLGF